MPEPPLPNLLYVGDVPVESSYHGSALLFRLMQRYPPERLAIIEGNLFATHAGAARLPGVQYHTLQVGRRRLLNSRLHTWYSRWLFKRAGSRVAPVRAIAKQHSPDAVLTVAHGYSWVTAARYASASRLPLHLIVHDDFARAAAPSLGASVEREFAAAVRQSASLLCVSPAMVDDYERRYGVRGTLLLPGRAFGAMQFDEDADRLRSPRGTPVFAFAGTINSPGYVTLLRRLAESLARVSAELLIFGPLDAAHADAAGLSLPNVRLGGLVTSAELVRRLRADVDVLFVPMSFADGDAANMRLSFPSKLTDYTAVGLPMLIWGPPDCSAVRWARENPGVAALVTSDSQRDLDAVVDRLLASLEYRRALASKAQEIGQRDFSAATAAAVFQSALQVGRVSA